MVKIEMRICVMMEYLLDVNNFNKTTVRLIKVSIKVLHVR